MDRTDYAILAILQEDARAPVKTIAERIGLALSSTHARIKALRDSGALRGAHASVDPSAFEVGIEALFMIELAKHERGTVDAFMDALTDVPEVRSAFLVTGQHDVVVHVVARDTAHLKDLALDRFTNRPGVTRIETDHRYYEQRHNSMTDLREDVRNGSASSRVKAIGTHRAFGGRSGRPVKGRRLPIAERLLSRGLPAPPA
jgi:DNA-binding Lrp family transcriptional regulator